MPKIDNDIAALRTILYLLRESVRVADERGQIAIGAKLSECAHAVHAELDVHLAEQQQVNERRRGNDLHRRLR